MIDTAASIARLIGQTIDDDMARDIVGSQVELERLRAEVESLTAQLDRLLWASPGGLARRPPGRDR